MRPIPNVFHINSVPKMTLNERFSRLNQRRGPNLPNTTPPIRRGGIQKFRPNNNRDMRGRINKINSPNPNMRTPINQNQTNMQLRSFPNRRNFRNNFGNRGGRTYQSPGFTSPMRGGMNVRGNFRGRGGRGGRGGGRQQQQQQSKLSSEQQKAILDKDLENFMHTEN